MRNMEKFLFKQMKTVGCVRRIVVRILSVLMAPVQMANVSVSRDLKVQHVSIIKMTVIQILVLRGHAQTNTFHMNAAVMKDGKVRLV